MFGSISYLAVQLVYVEIRNCIKIIRTSMKAKNTNFHESTGEQYIDNQQLMVRVKHQEYIIGEVETYR